MLSASVQSSSIRRISSARVLVGSAAAAVVIAAAAASAEHASGYSQVDSISDSYIILMLASRKLLDSSETTAAAPLQPALLRNVTLLDRRVQWSLQKHGMFSSNDADDSSLEVYRLEWMKVHLRGLAYQLEQQNLAMSLAESELYNISADDTPNERKQNKPLFEEELQVVYDTQMDDSYLDLDNTVRAHDKLDALLPKIMSASDDDTTTVPIHARHAEFQSQFMIPKRRYESVFRKLVNDVLQTCQEQLIPELESATVTQHYIDEPSNSLEAYVDEHDDGGKEQHHSSKMVVNIARSISYDKAQQLAVHELTHHFQNVLMEQHLYKQCPEMRVAPLFGPMGFLLEGGAEAFVDLYFNQNAGGVVDRVQDLKQRMASAASSSSTTQKRGDCCSPQTILDVEQVSWFGLWPTIVRIARDYQNGTIDKDKAIQLLLEQALKRHDSWPNADFMDQVGAYVAGYGYGRKLIVDYCSQQAAKRGTTALQEYIQFMKRPMLPSQMVMKMREDETSRYSR